MVFAWYPYARCLNSAIPTMDEKQKSISGTKEPIMTDASNSVKEGNVSIPTNTTLMGDSHVNKPQVTKDGFKLHPQPTADPLDPLNWSSMRKHTILGIVMFKYVFALF